MKYPNIVDYIFDTSISEDIEKLLQKYNIEIERKKEIFALRGAVIKKNIDIEALLEMSQKAFGFDDRKKREFVRDFLGYFILPMENYLPSIIIDIEKLGGKVSDYPVYRVPVDQKESSDILSTVLQEKNITLPESLKERLVFLTKAYIEGRRERAATKKMLMRGAHLGGLELADQVAEGILSAIDTKKPKRSVQKTEGKKIESKEEKIQKTKIPADKAIIAKPKEENVQKAKINQPSTLPVKAVTHALTKEVPIIAGEYAKEHKAQGKVLEQKTRVQDSSHHTRSVVQMTDDLLDEIWPILRKRMKKAAARQIIHSGVKGIRSERKIERLLAERYKLTENQATEIASMIAEKRMTYEKSLLPKKQKISDRSVIEKKERELEKKHFASLTKSAPHNTDRPVNTHVQVSAARTKSEEQDLQIKRMPKQADEILVKAAQPKPVKPKLSEPSVHASRDGKQKVTDIVYRKKLIGPVDELARMGVADFRRIAARPEDRMDELEERLNVLEETSYTDRIAGIKAWRKSPVHALYVQMMQTSLTAGISLSEVAAKRRERGEESLSAGEIQVIMQFNNKTRF